VDIDLLGALLAFSMSGWCFYRVLAKKEKNVFDCGLVAGATFMVGVYEVAPFLAKLIAVENDFWCALAAFFIAGRILYRIRTKKEKPEHILSSAISVGVMFMIGVFQIIPTLARLTAKWFFS